MPGRKKIIMSISNETMAARIDARFAEKLTRIDSTCSELTYELARGDLIEVATVLGQRKLARSVVFVAFSAEEWGLLGSRYYVEHPVYPLDDMLGMVNMDMIGRSGGELSNRRRATESKFKRLHPSAEGRVRGTARYATANPSPPTRRTDKIPKEWQRKARRRW